MGPRVLVLDNYDSFVYNLVQELGELGAEPVVFRNDAIDVAGIRAERPDAVLISPGPGRPEDGGVSLDAIAQLAGEIPLLGVCLGHQCIGQAYGGRDRGRPSSDARQDLGDPPRREGPVRRAPQPLRGHPLPLAGGAARERARRAGGHRDLDRRRRHGAAAPLPGRRGRAVPPRVGADRVRAGRCWPTSSGSWRRRREPPEPDAPCGAAPACRAEGAVVDVVVEVVDDVGVVDVVVVVVAGWQTEMVTEDPLDTEALAAGLWLSTLPGWAPPAQVVSYVVLATSPAPLIAVWAAPTDWPTTLGTVAQFPVETTRLTGVLGGSVAPAPGLCDDTTPCPYWLEQALLCDPTLRPAPRERRSRRRGRLPEHARHRHRRLRVRHGQHYRDVGLDLRAGRRVLARARYPPVGCWSRP